MSLVGVKRMHATLFWHGVLCGEFQQRTKEKIIHVKTFKIPLRAEVTSRMQEQIQDFGQGSPAKF